MAGQNSQKQTTFVTWDETIATSLLSRYTMNAMDESDAINREAVLLYLRGARRALRSARYNFDGTFYGVTVNRAYYAFLYAATALLLTKDLTRSRHSGVLAAFRRYFVREAIFPVQDSNAYGEAFELRNVADYEMLGTADKAQARTVMENAARFVEDCESYLSGRGYL